MEFLTETPRGVKIPSDTGLEKFSKASPRALQPHIKRALEKRLYFATAEQAARMYQFEKQEGELEELAREIIDHADSLREMRHALLNGGKQ